MLKLTLATAALFLALAPQAQASLSDQSACIDSAGGTYTLQADGSLVCANGYCDLTAPSRITDLRQTKTINDKSVTADETDMAKTLGALIGNATSSVVNTTTPAFYQNAKTKLFCTSSYTIEDWDSQQIDGELSGFQLN